MCQRYWFWLFLLVFGTVRKVWYFLFFIFITRLDWFVITCEDNHYVIFWTNNTIINIYVVVFSFYCWIPYKHLTNRRNYFNIQERWGCQNIVYLYLFLFQDVIKSANIKLDWDFKVSLLTDLVRVSC